MDDHGKSGSGFYEVKLEPEPVIWCLGPFGSLGKHGNCVDVLAIRMVVNYPRSSWNGGLVHPGFLNGIFVGAISPRK